MSSKNSNNSDNYGVSNISQKNDSRFKSPSVEDLRSQQTADNLHAVLNYFKVSEEERRSQSLRKSKPDSKLLVTNATKQFLFRNKKKVPKKYIYTREQIKQKKQTKYIFDKFDLDGSGGLDTEEVVAIFNEFNVDADTELIESLFGGKVDLTLLNFIKLSHSREAL